jgi:hypothetical protein
MLDFGPSFWLLVILMFLIIIVPHLQMFHHWFFSIIAPIDKSDAFLISMKFLHMSSPVQTLHFVSPHGISSKFLESSGSLAILGQRSSPAEHALTLLDYQEHH